MSNKYKLQQIQLGPSHLFWVTSKPQREETGEV